MLPFPEFTKRLHGWAPGPLPPVPDGKRRACRRCQTGEDEPAADARRPTAGAKRPAAGAAPGAAWSVCRRRQARRGRSAAAPDACRPCRVRVRPIGCCFAVDPGLTDSKIELRKLRQRCMVLRQDRACPMTGQRDPSQGRGGRDSDIVFFVKSQRKLRLRRNENHLDLDSLESKVRFPQARWPWARLGQAQYQEPLLLPAMQLKLIRQDTALSQTS
ncbi:hypothetical protein Bca4012_026548 [Brassica carinata]